MNIFTQFFSKNTDSSKRRSEITNELIRRESEIGKQIFGPIPKGGRRDFFCLDKTTWVWNEQWLEGSVRKKKNTTYSVREKDIVKSVNGGPYQSISLKEANNLRMASKLYIERVGKELYGQQSKLQ